MSLTIKTIPALHDNYIFLLTHQDQHFVIDPGEAAPVQKALNGQPLTAIFLTHHHADHTAGVAELVKTYNCPVHGNGADPLLPQNTQNFPLNQLLLPYGYPLQALPTPGHTPHHISYYLPQHNTLFCGDTLFTGGCGRLLGGTAEQLFNSLKTINLLPENTLIYSAHEYTVSNLTFAQHQDPHNIAIQNRLNWAKEQQKQNIPTVPTTLKEERLTNIFLQAPTLEKFTELRQLKDNF